MDTRTFSDPAVQERLERYRFVKVIAEDPTHPNTQRIMEQYEVQGLPYFCHLNISVALSLKNPLYAERCCYVALSLLSGEIVGKST